MPSIWGVAQWCDRSSPTPFLIDHLEIGSRLKENEPWGVGAVVTERLSYWKLTLHWWLPADHVPYFLKSFFFSDYKSNICFFYKIWKNADRSSEETQNCLNPAMAVCFTTMAVAVSPISRALLPCDLAAVPWRDGVCFSTLLSVGSVTTLTGRMWWFSASSAQSPSVA